MVILRIKGGLGNQLFQYATGFSLAKRLRTEIVIDSSFFSKQALRGYKLKNLNISCDPIKQNLPKGLEIIKNKYVNKLLRILNVRTIPCGKGINYLLETRSDMMPFVFENHDRDVYLDGYYQSEDYFSSCRKEILQMFTPKYSFSREFEVADEQIKLTLSVAVHVRRGDFLYAKKKKGMYHYLLDDAYYRKAMVYIESNLPKKPIYYWFSDDIEWTKSTFGEHDNFRYVCLRTENPDIDELLLMSHCKHIICANSTFSWWGAWLNENEEAMRIVPQRPFGQPRMIPEKWIKL